ncbi:hypothetical protein [uncultured Pseudoflavonifractor sp.]|uniref:hypothetical protein n=1 Tax=uncultured Pseudoflavonifractor sp. TaxID=1221379 RepID=UPI0025FA5742|nr:hypothetical protein [uncultured Pseudoflavonifractor sp.]
MEMAGDGRVASECDRELLEEMARYLGCQYLSDLRHCGARPYQAAGLMELGRQAGDKACLEAATYILGRKCLWSSGEEAMADAVEELLARDALK